MSVRDMRRENVLLLGVMFGIMIGASSVFLIMTLKALLG